MSDSEHDDRYEAHLKRQRPIHKGSSPPEQLEPPPELDRIVIGNARKAIQSSPPVPLYRAPKWALPATLATTILVSFAILLDLGIRAQRAEHQKQSAPVKTAATAPQTPAALPESATLPASSVAGAEQPPRIATNPWPPLPAPTRVVSNDAPGGAGATQEPHPDTARTRLARAEVAATRSRTVSLPPESPSTDGRTQ